MKLLLDTHLLLWALRTPPPSAKGRWSRAAALIMSPQNTPVFSAVSVWEVALKSQRRRSDFDIDADVFRVDLLASGYVELPITGPHAAGVARLPPVHGDPFDRLLVAQAAAEGMTLLTADGQIARYPGPILAI